MPRDSSGNYTLPAGNPVADSTVISSTWANPTMGDIANEITQSLDRNGRGGMLVPFRNVDGTVSAPGITFTAEPSTGIYRALTNDVRMSIGNDDTTRWIDANSQPVGEQEPFQIWDGQAWESPLVDGSSPTFKDTVIEEGFGLVIGHTAPITIEGGISNFSIVGTTSASAQMAISRFSNDNQSPLIVLMKSKDPSIEGHTAVEPGDGLGAIYWYADDGTTYDTVAARLRSSVDQGGVVSTGVVPGAMILSVADSLGVLRDILVLDSDQTATFSGDLTVSAGEITVLAAGAAIAQVRVGQTGTGSAQIQLDASNGDFAGADYVQITQYNDLNLGIATTGNGGEIRIAAATNDPNVNPDLSISTSHDVTIHRGDLTLSAGGWSAGTGAAIPSDVYGLVTAAGTARIRVETTGTGGANIPAYQLYNEGLFKGAFLYNETANQTQIFSNNGSLPTITMTSANNVSIPNGDLTVSAGMLTLDGGSYSAASTGQGVMYGGATSGLTLHGHGSTYDVTIANQNGINVLTVIQNTVNVVLAGDLTLDAGDLLISNTTPKIFLTDTDTGADHEINASSSVGNLRISVDVSSEGSSPKFVVDVAGTDGMTIDGNGDTTVGGDLTLGDGTGGDRTITIRAEGENDAELRLYESTNSGGYIRYNGLANTVVVGTNDGGSETTAITIARGSADALFAGDLNLSAGKLSVTDGTGVALVTRDVASLPNEINCIVGMSTVALSGVNGDLVLGSRSNIASGILFYYGSVGTAIKGMELKSDGDLRVNSLAGTGTRNVVVDSNGVMSAP